MCNSRRGGRRRSRHRQRVYTMVGCAAKRRQRRRRTRRHRHRHNGGGGGSCGACGCPIAPFSWSQMNAAPTYQRGGDCGCSSGNLLPTFGGDPSASASQTGGGDTVDAGSPYAPCGVSNCNPIIGAGQYGGSSFYKAPAPIPGPFVGSPWGASIAKWPVVDGISGDRNYNANIGGVIDNDPALQMRMDDSGYNTASSQVGGYRYNSAAASAMDEMASLAPPVSAPSLPLPSPVSPSSSPRRRRSRRLRRRRSSSSSSASSPPHSSPHSHSYEKRRRRSSLKRGGGLLPQELVNMGRAATYQVQSAYNTLAGVPAPVNPAPYKDQLVDQRPPLVTALAATA